MSIASESILLFDIDGVLAMDGDTNNKAFSEIISLHPNVVEIFQKITFPVAILTHRSRHEAEQILAALKINKNKLVACFTAHDILRSALENHQYALLLKQGLKKSFVIPLLENKYGFKKENIAVVDDRPENLSVLVENGVGLAMLAPHTISRCQNSVMSFELEQVISLFNEWIANHQRGMKEKKSIVLTGKQRHLDVWSQTGKKIEAKNKIFIYFRWAGRNARKGIVRIFRQSE